MFSLGLTGAREAGESGIATGAGTVRVSAPLLNSNVTYTAWPGTSLPLSSCTCRVCLSPGMNEAVPSGPRTIRAGCVAPDGAAEALGSADGEPLLPSTPALGPWLVSGTAGPRLPDGSGIAVD